MNKWLLFVATLQLALALPGAAQDSPYYAGCGKYTGLVFSYSGSPAGPYPGSLPDAGPDVAHVFAADSLRGVFGVRLNTEGLRVALRSGDVIVRYLAAWVLADRGQKDAIPEIFTAFETGSQPRPKAYLACALAELGDPRGVAALHQFCKSDGLPEDLRLDVVRFLAELHETPCIRPVAEALEGGPPGNWQAMTIIPEIKGLSREESAQLRALLLRSLTDPGSAVRLVSVQTLSQMHDSSAAPALQTVLSSECDPRVRKALGDALKSLHAEQR
jgi:HEAT repeat protein